jgi:1,4-dihydroxy-2-naphthoate octaprenyltransferase
VPGGRWVMTVGTLNLLLSFLYSWRPVRLKSSSIGLDIVSHTLMLGGLLPLAGYLVYSHELTAGILWIVTAATLGSTYGQIYNQVRDFQSDQAAGIVNATTRLSRSAARIVMYGAVLLAIGTGILGAMQLRFPPWAIPASVAAILIGLLSVGFIHTDASGKPPLDFTGRLQNAFWIALGLLIIVWVLWALGWMSS